MRLLANTPTPISATGSCPHGMPMGMCPSCSAGGGGGGGKLRPGEISFEEGAALWAAFKANKLRQQDQTRFLAQQALAQRIENGVQGGLIGQPTGWVGALAQRLTGGLRAWMQTLASPQGLKPNDRTALTTALRDQIVARLERALDITDKLATVLGEKEKLLREKLETALRRIRRWVVEESLFGRFISVLGDVNQRFQSQLVDLSVVLANVLKRRPQIQRLWQKGR